MAITSLAIALCISFSMASCSNSKPDMRLIDGQALYEKVESLAREKQKDFLYSLSERELLSVGNAAVKATNDEEYAMSILMVLHDQYWKENQPDAEAVLYFLEKADLNISQLWTSYLCSQLAPFIQDWTLEQKERLVTEISNRILDPSLSALDKDFYIRGLSQVGYAVLPKITSAERGLSSEEMAFVKKLTMQCLKRFGKRDEY
ncbi:hypothetical protein K8I31_09075, partial [bacterium]|nr:hypothetical protein [bacterium]